jgi:hypothetical protein
MSAFSSTQNALKDENDVTGREPTSTAMQHLSILSGHSITSSATVKQQLRHVDAEGLGSLEIDDQLELGRLLDRKVAWFLTFEDSRDVNACLVLGVRKAGRIADQAPGDDELPKRVHRRNRVEARQRHQLFAAAIEKRGVREEKGFDSSLNECREGRIDLVFIVSVMVAPPTIFAADPG